uniref:Cytokine like 1 n=1 Tax=Oryctolagus cuniculus TaxID=9986 RepID=A0A5F9CZG1_RABIT
MTRWPLPLLLLLLAGPPPAAPAPPTCYSRLRALSRELTRDFQSLQDEEPSEPCVKYLPALYLDIHNYCVLAKLRDFVASPQCWHVARVDALKDQVRKLYTLMNSFCRRVRECPTRGEEQDDLGVASGPPDSSPPTVTLVKGRGFGTRRGVGGSGPGPPRQTLKAAEGGRWEALLWHWAPQVRCGMGGPLWEPGRD